MVVGANLFAETSRALPRRRYLFRCVGCIYQRNESLAVTGRFFKDGDSSCAHPTSGQVKDILALD